MTNKIMFWLKKSSLLVTTLLYAPLSIADSGYFVMSNTTGNITLLSVAFVIGVVLSFLNFGKIINLFGSFLLLIIGIIILLNIQVVIGMLIIVLGLISMLGIEK